MMRSAALLLCALALTGTAHAQSTDMEYQRELTLAMSPEYPAAGDTVRLTIQTYALDLNRSQVIWYANGREIARGVGLTETSVSAGPAGSGTEIRVIAEDEEGLRAGAVATIRPAEVDLIWEAVSYAPPFYEGRILPGSGSPIRLQALARFRDGTRLIPENDIIFTWHRNTSLLSEGRGKSSITISGPSLFGTDTIRVTAASHDGSFNGSASVRITSIDPFPVLYENHPLFGILYRRALEGTANTLETEQKLTAVPYFANVTSLADASLQYEWRVGNMTIVPDAREPHTLTLTSGGYTGPLDIELSLTSLTDFAMRATGTWQLNFGGTDSLFFSGNPFGGR